MISLKSTSRRNLTEIPSDQEGNQNHKVIGEEGHGAAFARKMVDKEQIRLEYDLNNTYYRLQGRNKEGLNESKVCPRCGLVCEKKQYICPRCWFNFVADQAPQQYKQPDEKMNKKKGKRRKKLRHGDKKRQPLWTPDILQA